MVDTGIGISGKNPGWRGPHMPAGQLTLFDWFGIKTGAACR
jgi:hypothetical protein